MSRFVALLLFLAFIIATCPSRADGCTGFGKEYQGECWNRHTYSMTPERYVWSTNPMGELVLIRQSQLSRQMEVFLKARRILYDSPPDAPLAEIWLVYDQLKWKLNMISDYKKIAIRSRQSATVWRQW